MFVIYASLPSCESITQARNTNYSAAVSNSASYFVNCLLFSPICACSSLDLPAPFSFRIIRESKSRPHYHVVVAAPQILNMFSSFWTSSVPSSIVVVSLCGVSPLRLLGKSFSMGIVGCVHVPVPSMLVLSVFMCVARMVFLFRG